MKRCLQLIALVLAIGGLASWFATGAHRGFTMTSVPEKTVDAVTGIEGITYRKQFVPGLDFLGATLLGGGLLAGASLLIRNKPTHEKTT